MKKLVLFIFLISVFMVSCKKDESTGPTYQIITGSVTDITNIRATITGNLSNVSDKYITSFGHVWSTSPNPTINLTTKTTFGPVNTDTTFTSDITFLKQGTAYYIRAYTIDNQGTYYGEELSFTTESSFFEFVVSSTYLRNDDYLKIRGWVILYNVNKELLGIKEISNGNNYSFDWPTDKKTNKYMVQILLYNDYIDPDYSDNYNMSCYLNVEPEVWYLGSEPENEYTQIGTNIVTLTDLNLYNYYFYVAQNQYSWGYFDELNQTIEFYQYFDPDKIWITYYNEGQAPFYKWIPNVSLNQSFKISSSDFTQMTSYVDISLAVNTRSYVYIESEDDLSTDFGDYFEVYYKGSNNLTNVRVYYPGDLFSGYYTYISVRHDNIYEYMIKYRGAIPTQFVSLPADIAVINEDITSYSATFSGEADIFSSFWIYSEDSKSNPIFHYYIYGSSNDVGSFSAPALPEEITNLNESLLNLSKLNYYGSSIREYNYISDYNDYIYQCFVQPNIPSGIKEYYFSKYIYKENLNATDLIYDRNELQRVKRNSLVE